MTRITVFEIIDEKLNNIKILGSDFNYKQTANTEIVTNHEEFYILIDIDYDDMTNTDFSISSYASKPILFQLMQSSTEKLKEDECRMQLFLGLFVSYTQTFDLVKCMKLESISNLKFKCKILDKKEWVYNFEPDQICRRFYGEMLGYIVFLYFNNTRTEFTDAYVEKELVNVVFAYPFKGNKGNSVVGWTAEIPAYSVGFTMLKFGGNPTNHHFCRINSQVHFKKE